jgi:hypothetical protein
VSCRFAAAVSKIADRFFLFLFFSCSLFCILLLFIGKFGRVRSGPKGSEKKKRRLPNRTHLRALEERNNNKGGVRVGVDGWLLAAFSQESSWWLTGRLTEVWKLGLFEGDGVKRSFWVCGFFCWFIFWLWGS